MKFKKHIFVTIVLVLTVHLVHCSSSQQFATPEPDLDVASILARIDGIGPPKAPDPVVFSIGQINALRAQMKNIPDTPVESGEIAVLETSKGIIIFSLLPSVAPNHCANFKKLANSGFYDWTTFHRVIPGFMIQGGDINSKNNNPRDDGTGNPGYIINAEINQVPHTKGIVSAARGPDINSAGSQFFIMVDRASNLDGQYSAFGSVIYGMETAEKIVRVRRDPKNNRPRENVYIERARVIKR